MRIIAGRFKGKKLVSPKRMTTRPTLDRVKESYFRIVQDQVTGVKFLDLCAGSGAIGLEAFSREAGLVVFVERDHRLIRLIKANLEKCGIVNKDHRIQLLPFEVQKCLTNFDRTQTQFHLIYFDPPYSSDLYFRCLNQIGTSTILARQGMICVEHNQSDFPKQIGKLKQTKEKKYGDTRLSFFRKEE